MPFERFAPQMLKSYFPGHQENLPGGALKVPEIICYSASFGLITILNRLVLNLSKFFVLSHWIFNLRRLVYCVDNNILKPRQRWLINATISTQFGTCIGTAFTVGKSAGAMTHV